MRCVVFTNSVSPHQLPLARELASHIGVGNFRYVYTTDRTADRRSLGWKDEREPWVVKYDAGRRRDLEDCETLISGIRDLPLFELRSSRGLKTFYMSERWFKPFVVHLLGMDGGLIPGRIRMLKPSYRRMANRMVRFLTDDVNAYYLAIGPWAAKDMKALGVPDAKIIPWGYFVEPGRDAQPHSHSGGKTLRLLCVTRLVPLKRVDTVIRAVKLAYRLRDMKLTIVGDGPERARLERMALGCPVEFMGLKPISEIRDIMRGHDVLVFSSNARDGWGAVVSEALEEGLRVVGTYETGASATILPEGNLFHAGDHERLAEILMGRIAAADFSSWTAKAAARRLLEMI